MKSKRKCVFWVAVVLFSGIALVSFSCDTGSIRPSVAPNQSASTRQSVVQNPLANTSWHGIDPSREGWVTILQFGQTSFIWQSRYRNMIKDNFNGEYEVVGDTIIFYVDGRVSFRGALIGGNLTARQFHFRRWR